jgi:hypothetical protein
MEYSTSSGMAKVFVNGKLVDQTGFMTENDGSKTSYLFSNDDNIITGDIDNNKLREEELMQLLDYPASSQLLIDRLKKDFPLTHSKQSKKKSKKREKKQSRKK